MNIHLTVDATSYTATLNDCPATRDLAAQLPLTLTLTDYASSEKTSELPEELSTSGAPSGTTARAGDVTYYAPWGNLAIFYRNFGHAAGLVRLGAFDSGIEQFVQHGNSFTVTITRAD